MYLRRNPSEASRRREASLWRSTVAKGEDK